MQASRRATGSERSLRPPKVSSPPGHRRQRFHRTARCRLSAAFRPLRALQRDRPCPQPPDLADCSASELLRLYRSGQASPVEAVQAVHERIAQLNPQSERVLSDRHRRLAASGTRERGALAGIAHDGAPCGELDGVPVSIKDLILTRGWPTLRGSRTVDPHQPWDVDAPVVARLREAGAVLLGKTATPEFGCKGETNSPLTGLTRNPWNLAQDARRLVGRRRGGGGGGHGPAGDGHRRRRQRAHPGGVLRHLRPEAELRAGAGVPAVAVRHGLAPRAAHDERARRGADDERDQAPRRARLDLAAARRQRLPGGAGRRRARPARRLLADARLREERARRDRRCRRRRGAPARDARRQRRARRPRHRRPAGDHHRPLVRRLVDAVEHADAAAAGA